MSVTIRVFIGAGNGLYTKLFRVEALPRIGESVEILSAGIISTNVKGVTHCLGEGVVDIDLVDDPEVEAECLIENGWTRE